MLFSHRFGSLETLSRAHYWLTRHGFEVVKTDDPAHDVTRLTLNVGYSKASAALALIDSIERSDPEGWPGISTPSRTPRFREMQAKPQARGRHSEHSSTPIHWHHHEETSPADPVSSRVREYMFSRWE
jgi:hypothetical protein